MKQSLLSALENKYYYAVSRYFWHIVIAVGILGIGAGILVYFWSLVPPKERQVIKQPAPTKPDYPKLKEITLQEIIRALPKRKIKTKIPTTTKTKEEYEPVNYQEQEIISIDSTALAAFNRSLGQTKNLITVETNKNFWEDTYIKKFNSERDKKMYKKTHNPNLYKLILTHPGFKTRFINFTDKQNLNSYYDKADLLDSYNFLLEHLDSLNRIKFLNRIGYNLPVKNLGSKQISQRLGAISSLIGKVPANEQLHLFNILWKFIKNNPNDGIPLIKFIAGHINQVPYDVRMNYINNILREYVTNYNNNLYGLKEATNHFIDKITQLEPDRVPLALKIYYKLYRKNNHERTRQIEQIDYEYNQALTKIDREYQRELAQAKADYMRANHKKQSWRQWSFKGIAAGFVSLLLFSLVLLILSMIRNVNRLTEAMYEQNHSFQNQLSRMMHTKTENSTENKDNRKTENITNLSENKKEIDDN